MPRLGPGSEQHKLMPFSVAFHTYSSNDFFTPQNINGNINQLIAEGNAIDHSYVGPAGFFASQFIPVSVGTGTFNGSQPYTFPVEVDFTGSGVTGVNPAISGDGASPAGMIINVPTGSTNGAQMQVNGVTLVSAGSSTASLSTTVAANVNGILEAEPTINSAAALGPVGPGYTNTGVAL